MNIFKTYKFDWKQVGIFKLALLTIGAIIGAYFADFVKDYVVILVVVAAIASVYSITTSLKQIK